MGGEAIASPVMTGVTVVDHPLVARHLSVLRDKATPSGDFRRRLSDISMLLLFEALHDLRVREDAIETPLETTGGMRLADEIVVIAILRAGLGMTDGALRLIPEARVGHLGLYRDEESLQPVGYYESVPRHATDAEVIVVDPMLATGGSAVSALDRLKRDGVGRPALRLPRRRARGHRRRARAHPEVPIFCAAVDRELDGRGYIRPGLGDAGDRIFGTDEGEELAAAIQRLAAWAERNAPQPESKLRIRVRDHLGADPGGLEVVNEELSEYDYVNVQVALDALAETTGAAPEIVGLSLEHGWRVGLTELAQGGGFGGVTEPGPVEYVQVDVGDRVVSC